MRHTPPAVIALLVASLAGCTNSPPATSATGTGTTRAGATDPHHPRVPPENVRDVMYAKLAHAHAVLEGMALEDFNQVEANALELEALSKQAGWRVHTTVAYGVLSDEFGAIAAQLADAAQASRMAGVTQSYMQMAESCIACHTFLRREGLYRDVPGEVSEASPALDAPGLLTSVP